MKRNRPIAIIMEVWCLPHPPPRDTFPKVSFRFNHGFGKFVSQFRQTRNHDSVNTRFVSADAGCRRETLRPPLPPPMSDTQYRPTPTSSTLSAFDSQVVYACIYCNRHHPRTYLPLYPTCFLDFRIIQYSQLWSYDTKMMTMTISTCMYDLRTMWL